MSSQVVARAATAVVHDLRFEFLEWLQMYSSRLEIFLATLLARARKFFSFPSFGHAPMSYGDEHDCHHRQSRIFEIGCVTLQQSFLSHFIPGGGAERDDEKTWANMLLRFILHWAALLLQREHIASSYFFPTNCIARSPIKLYKDMRTSSSKIIRLVNLVQGSSESFSKKKSHKRCSSWL